MPTLSPELSRRLGRLGNTPYLKRNPVLFDSLKAEFFKVKTESALPDRIKKLLELCDLSAQIAIDKRIDDDQESVRLMMQQLKREGKYSQYFGAESA